MSTCIDCHRNITGDKSNNQVRWSPLYLFPQLDWVATVQHYRPKSMCWECFMFYFLFVWTFCLFFKLSCYQASNCSIEFFEIVRPILIWLLNSVTPVFKVIPIKRFLSTHINPCGRYFWHLVCQSYENQSTNFSFKLLDVGFRIVKSGVQRVKKLYT